MASRIVLFGATGYIGRLTAQMFTQRNIEITLVGRNAASLAKVAADLGGVPTGIADAANIGGLASLLRSGDVLVSTVGPFQRFGHAAIEAAVSTAATYIDSTGEPPFLRRVFEEYGPRAAARGCALIPAFGCGYVPGNLAAALALRHAEGKARRVDVGYFARGAGGFSGGMTASAAWVALKPGYAWRDGALRSERNAARIRSFHAAGRSRDAVSVGGTEHFALPRIAPYLSEVNVYLGWTGLPSRMVLGGSAMLSLIAGMPRVRHTIAPVVARLLPGSTGGPDAHDKGRTVIVAESYDGTDRPLSTVMLECPSPYDLTAELLVWSACAARDGEIQGTGALGPVEAFGLDALERACKHVGIARLA